MASASFSASLDIYLAAYPAVVLWPLEINWKRKLALSIALGLGLCAGAVGIYKCTRIPGFIDRNDFTYGTDDLVLWTNIESNCVIMAACIPTLAPLLDMVFGRNPLSRSAWNSTRFNPPNPKKTDIARPASVELACVRSNMGAEGGAESQEMIEGGREEVSGRRDLDTPPSPTRLQSVHVRNEPNPYST